MDKRILAQHSSTDLEERQGSEQRRSCFYCLVHSGIRVRAIDSAGSTVAHWDPNVDQDVLAFVSAINAGGEMCSECRKTPS